MFASNANLTVPPPFCTGGSWKKSPVTTTCARGCQDRGSGRFRMADPMYASLSKSSPSTMDTTRHPSTTAPDYYTLV
ncbi:hypothetical protein OH77DRAFT_1398033 [Trametes cingulata]|nr:hypothetical protein OH77DRAFT_1398033 [Trametes cingulata]